VSVSGRCENCYQLLAVELMYNSSFYPVVLGVSGQPAIGLDALNVTGPSLDSGSGRTQDNIRQSVFSDTLKLVFAKNSVHRSLFDSFQMVAEALNSGVTGLQCLISHDLCLTEDDLTSLMASRREMLNTGRFRRIYPTASGNRYTGYLQQLQALMLQDTNNIFQPVNSLFRETLRHSTADLHAIQTRLEHAFSAGSPESLLDVDPEPGVDDEYSYPNENLLSPRWVISGGCCRCAPTCSWHLATRQALNTTLGLGSNRISIILQDTVTGSALNTYRLTLHRHTADYAEPSFHSDATYAVCGLRQECDYRISPGEPCGLQQEQVPGVTSWPHILQGLRRLPVCTDGDAV
ncbi:hypothetical protein Cfor_11647, partial [Coptotermes formosanus]